MGNVTQEQVVEYISNLRLGQVQELIGALETRLGVCASVPTAPFGWMGTSNPPPPESDPEPTEFDVILTGFTGKKVDVIKVVRKALGLGLRDARDAVDAAPTTLREAVSAEEAAELRAALEAVSATVEVR